MHPLRATTSAAHVSFSARSFDLGAPMLYPDCLSLIWVWLYGFGGILLRMTGRMDIHSTWLRDTLDVEQKPLQSIGLVAGLTLAFVYWSAVTLKQLLQ